MSVKIGHASGNENGGITGGQAGDQTKNEVCIRSWYDRGWTLVLRPVSAEIAEKMAKACEAGCANACIGYCQEHRNDLRVKARAENWDLAKIKTPCECDCSSFMAVCAEAAGVKMEQTYTAGNAPATFQMRAQWAKTGAFQTLTEAKYRTGEKYLRRGDVLVNEQAHTAMVLSDGELASGKNSEIIIDGKRYPIDRLLVGGKNYFAIREITEVLEMAGVAKLEIGNRGNIAVLHTKKQ